MSKLMQEVVQQAIIGKIVTTLLEDNFGVEVDYNPAVIMIYAWAAEGNRPNKRFDYWIKIHTDNEPESIINDYTTNLENVLKPVFEFIEKVK